jgi:hypothetical protein
VLPVWQAKLPAAEFTKFSDILEGGMRAKFRKDDEKRAAADTVTESASMKTADLLRRLGIAPEEKEEAPQATPKAPEPEEEAFELETPEGMILEEPDTSEVFPPSQEALPRVFPGIDGLVEAVRMGRLPLQFRAREDMTSFARYRIGEREVELRLVEGNTRNYVIGAVAVGYSRLPGGEDMVDDMALEMGYRKTDDQTYRRREGDFVLRIRMLADHLDMPCGYPKGGGAGITVQQIQKIHRDLGELLERLEAQA